MQGGIELTIVEAIKNILIKYPDGLTTKGIYNEIIRLNLYNFGAKNPIGVVNGELRRHCVDLEFPTANPVKHFTIAGYEGKKIKFTLIDYNLNNQVLQVAKKNIENTEFLPEEKIINALEEHLFQIKQQLLDNVIEKHPNFFEQLVVDLLLKMGYGYDKHSGIVTGGPHDNGIDGIISEDKLGLDLIYIQAKRYSSNNKIGRKEIQAFIGAMGHIQKGVFITTSSFTQDALAFGIEQQQKNIKLIDGKLLADFMIKYGIGVESVKTFNIYKISSDYFQE